MAPESTPEAAGAFLPNREARAGITPEAFNVAVNAAKNMMAAAMGIMAYMADVMALEMAGRDFSGALTGVGLKEAADNWRLSPVSYTHLDVYKRQEEDVRLIRNHITTGVRIKASAGIRTYEKAERLILAGADRIGTSAGAAIMRSAGK